MSPDRPWRGLYTATALPFNDDLSVDYDAYAEHCRWLVEQGCDGVVPNGSLVEYQTLTAEERARVVETAVAAIKHGAYDFIEKPFKADRLVLVAQRALETSRLKREVKALKQLSP